GGARADAHQPLPVVGAPGRSAAQEAMRSGDPQDLLLAIGISIIAAAVFAVVARSARQPLILGYILAGVALGPHLGLGVVTDETSIELISEIGLILLLFIIGLEINVPSLAQAGRTIAVSGRRCSRPSEPACRCSPRRSSSLAWPCRGSFGRLPDRASSCSSLPSRGAFSWPASPGSSGFPKRWAPSSPAW